MTEAKSLQDARTKIVLKYIPETEESPRGYLTIVKDQIMGRDKEGKERPFEDLIYFLKVAKNAGLDPTLKQIYAVYRWDNSLGREVMSVQAGIDGLRTIAERTGLYAGSDDPVLEFDKSGKPVKATSTVYKVNPVNGERMPTTATAYWKEYYPASPKMRFMWDRMPNLMIGKCAEALALRKAFPTTSQIYIPEEMHQASDSDYSLPAPKENQDQKKVKASIKKAKAKLKKTKKGEKDVEDND